MKMIQYNLWSSCKNNCSFCFNKDREKDVDKIDNIKHIINLLDLEEVNDYDTIALIGGELFDFKYDKDLRKVFYELIDKIKDIIKNTNKRLYIMTNLIYNRELEFESFINYLEDYKDKLTICTSYDLKGRFHTKQHLELFNDNIAYLKANNINIHIEMILTDILLKSILNNTFNLKEFKEIYTDNIDFIAPHCGCYGKTTKDFTEDKEFFTTRKTFLKFLKKEFIELKDIDINRFLNRSNHSDICYYLVNDKLVKYKNRINTVGSMPQDKPVNYRDDDKHSMYEDFLTFKEML